jgi:RNA polymerase sigma factor (sigma-70 family)
MMSDDPLSAQLPVSGHDLLTVAFETHFADMYRYSCVRVGQSYAEDIVAEAFARAAARIASFDASRSTMRAWLFGIENNVIREWLRNRERQRLLVIKSQPLDDVDHHGGVIELRALLEGLAPKDAEILLMVDAFGLSYSEASHGLGVPVGTVRSRLAMARRRLRKQLQA